MIILDDKKPWIVKTKNGVRFVVCPYCNVKKDFPYERCDNCHNEIGFPEEQVIVKKEWW